MNSIDLLLQALNPTFIPDVTPQIVQFYAHIDPSALKLIAISPSPAEDTLVSLELDTDLAIKFLSGEENTCDWVVGFVDEQYKLIKADTVKSILYSRTELSPIIELFANDIAYPDIKIVVDKANDELAIHYDGSKIANWSKPAKFYFTRDGDLSYLKCAFSLDINILDKILKMNNLTSWPNPIILPIPEIDDLSIYSIKSNLTIGITEI